MRAWLKIAAIGVTLLLSNKAWTGEVTMPSSLTADTTDFVLLSDSGTAPSISGFDGTLLVTATASAGNVKITTTSNTLRASGYCGYSADADSEASDCSGNSLTEIGFRGTQANINTALATLSFKGDGAEGSPTITLAVTPAGTNYYSGTGHYYEVVSATKTWSQAKALAAASTYEGLTGYLVTITSAGENAFIKAKVNANSWIGASDDNNETTGTTVEGHWQWVTGPEAGKTFFCDDIDESDGCEVDDGYSYQNWNSGEPNNSGNESRGQFYTASGNWNDLRTTHTQTAYIIEYGGLNGETATVSGTTTLTINSIEASGSTYDAFDDKQLSAMVEEQTESVKRWMFNSTNSVMGRMEQFRRTGENNGLRLSDFKLALSNGVDDQDIESRLKKHYIDKYSKKVLDSKGITKDKTETFISELPLTKYMASEFGLKPKNWAFWSNGLISTGGIDFAVGELGRRNSSAGFTLGADYNLTDNSLFGFALREENEDSKISTDGSKFNSDNFNLSFYNTWKPLENNFIDTYLSLGETTISTTRVVDTSNDTKVTGEMKSKQLFGAVKYNFETNYKMIKLNNFSSFNFSFVSFGQYTEKGDSNLKLSFDDRHFESTSLNLGTVISSDLGLRNSFLFPYIKIEFNEDLSEKSTLKANYASSPSNQYTTNINKSFSSMINLETGFDWNFNNGWNLSTTLNRMDKNDIGHQNFLKFNANRIF